MSSDLCAAVQSAILAAITSPTYRPARLPPLDEPHWAKFADEPVELLEGLKQKRMRKGYSKLGRLALEHCVVIMLGESVFDELDGYVKTIQRQILSENVLAAILKKIDARLLGKRASASGFLQFVGALWVSHNYNTGEVSALLWPTLEPLVEIAGTTYTDLKRRADTASDGKKLPKISDDLQFLMNARGIQASYVPHPSSVSPARSDSSDSDESMASPNCNVDRTASSPYQFRVEERDPAEFYNPAVSPGTFESEAGASERSGSHPPLVDSNKLLRPAILRTPIAMEEDEAHRSREFFEYSPRQSSSSSSTDAYSLSPYAFNLPANLGLARSHDVGHTVLHEIENTPAPSAGDAALLAPAFEPVVKPQPNATASSSKVRLDSGLGSAAVDNVKRSPLAPSNGQSPRGGPISLRANAVAAASWRLNGVGRTLAMALARRWRGVAPFVLILSSVTPTCDPTCSMGKKVCICPKCILHHVVVDGHRIPGRKVSQQERRLHEIAAAASRSPDYAKAPKSHPVGVEESSDEEGEKWGNKSRDSPGIAFDNTLIIQLCAALLVWLNLKASVGRETANTVLKALQFILTAALELLQVTLAAQGIPIQLPKLRIPQDLRTIYRNYTSEPEIAKAWFRKPTKGERDIMERETGVRGCSLHLLPYRDPVNDTLLGFMHWLEGILGHQLRVLWGVGRDARRKKNLAEFDADDEDMWTDEEISEAGGDADARDVLDDEAAFDPEEFAQWREGYLQATRSDDDSEGEDSQATPKATPAPGFDDPMDGSMSGATSVPESDPPDDNNYDNDDDRDDEFTDIGVRGSWKFTKERLDLIRRCIREVTLPTHVARPPGNLGEAKHGKLKAEEYLTLFSVIFPLVLPDMELDDDPARHEAMLKSYCDLVGCTNIAASFKTSNSAADLFMNYYSDYFPSLQTLFPDVDVLPTHHYSWHIPDILRNWGPLASQNEFMGERVNGVLQDINTNDHFYDMDYTRVRHFARLGRLLARKHDKPLQGGKDATLQGLHNILDPADPKTLQSALEVDDEQQAKFLAKKCRDISKPLYTLILDYLALSGEHKLNFYGTRNAAGTITLPDPDHTSMILPPRGKRCLKFHLDKRTYSCSSSRAGSSRIHFYEPGTNPAQNQTSTGVITAILRVPLDKILRTFVVVRRYRNLPSQFYADHPELMTAVVDLEPEQPAIIIEPRHVITHLATWKSRVQINGATKPALKVCWALNRGRR
ncbi:hypothetical protein C8R47DRAFT_1218460 [Mycena vitilis]|nr:hypothetical protein C8R47DRAFT_1218460 [Mycena vitilis]